MATEILMSHSVTNPSNDIPYTNVNIPTKQNSQIILSCAITSAIVPIVLGASMYKTRVIVFSINNTHQNNGRKKLINTRYIPTLDSKKLKMILCSLLQNFLVLQSHKTTVKTVQEAISTMPKTATFVMSLKKQKIVAMVQYLDIVKMFTIPIPMVYQNLVMKY